MSDIMQLDRSRPLGRVRTMNPAKQKVFFVQDGIDYDSAGRACNPKQIQAFLQKQAEDAQTAADAAKAQLAQAQEAAKAAAAAVKAAGSKKSAAA